MEQDALSLLEEKIQRVMDAMAEIRREKDEAQAAAAASRPLQDRLAELERDLDTARNERDALRADKEVVRKRVEKLLAQLDTLAGG